MCRVKVDLFVSNANTCRPMGIEYEKAYVCVVYVFACMCIGNKLSTTTLKSKKYLLCTIQGVN